MLVFSQILDYRLRIDIAVLCHIVDVICVTASLALTYKENRSLHSLVAPRTRLLQALSGFAASPFLAITPGIILTLCQCVVRLVDAALDEKSQSESVFNVSNCQAETSNSSTALPRTFHEGFEPQVQNSLHQCNVRILIFDPRVMYLTLI
jgi:hypothetical protein